MAKVLIGYSACPLSRAAFEKYGHDVWTCDILPARDDSPKHLQMDIWQALRLGWDFAVLHPMCTYMTTSGAWALMDPDYNKYPVHGYHQKPNPKKLYGKDRRTAQKIDIMNFEALLDLPFPVAIENPAISAINTMIRPPDQKIHPYQAGDDASKNTGFWLTKGTPKLKIDPASFVEPRLVCNNKHRFAYGLHKCPECGSEKYLPRWSNQTDGGQNNLSPGDKRWLDRSETYPGIARLMEQWARWLNAK